MVYGYMENAVINLIVNIVKGLVKIVVESLHCINPLSYDDTTSL